MDSCRFKSHLEWVVYIPELSSMTNCGSRRNHIHKRISTRKSDELRERALLNAHISGFDIFTAPVLFSGRLHLRLRTSERGHVLQSRTSMLNDRISFTLCEGRLGKSTFGACPAAGSFQVLDSCFLGLAMCPCIHV